MTLALLFVNNFVGYPFGLFILEVYIGFGLLENKFLMECLPFIHLEVVGRSHYVVIKENICSSGIEMRGPWCLV